MHSSATSTLLIALCISLAACGSKRSSTRVSPEVRAANIAKNNAIWESRSPVDVNGQPYEVAISPDKKYVLVGSASPTSKMTLNNLKAAGLNASGCPANPAGLLAFIPPDKEITTKDTRFIRVELDCSPEALAKQEFRSRGLFDNYPQPGTTYLSFSKQHGFQVNYIAEGGKAWLWYPGNRRGVVEEWKLDPGLNAVCWRHPSNTYNPVTKTKGGEFQCQSRSVSIDTIVSSQQGDPYNLASGSVPNARDKCTAPVEFNFDRSLFGC